MKHIEFVGSGQTVPVLHGQTRRYINFDNAASTPALESVAKKVADFLPLYSSVHRGQGYKSRVSTEAYEHARRTIAAFVGANQREHTVIFTQNTTHAINKLARRLRLTKKDVVIISSAEHHSNDLPWRECATVMRIKTTTKGAIDQKHFTDLLLKYSGRVKLVAITGASNVTGHMPDIHWFARRAHAHNAQIFVDCAQLAAHRRIKMYDLNEPEHLDYIAISAHKMYAPFGVGALIGRRDTFERGTPDHVGGGTVDFVSESAVDWAAPPERDEAGSPNVIGAVAFAKAAETLIDIGLENIARHEADLTAYALQQLTLVPGLQIFGDSDPSQTASHGGVIAFDVANKPHGLVASILSYEWGIGVRSGCFCAQPYVAKLLKLNKSQLAQIRTDLACGRRNRLPGLVRISFGLYNTKAEIDALQTALMQITQNNHADYRQDSTTGDFHPID